MGVLNPGFIETLKKTDPLLDLRFNPRIRRWIVVQDLSLSSRPDVWRRPHQDLVGVPGVGERTQLVRLFKLEDNGIPIVPNVEWITREIHLRSRDSRDDTAFNDVLAQDARTEAEQSKRIRDWAAEDGEYRWALLRRRSWSYAGQTNRTGRC